MGLLSFKRDGATVGELKKVRIAAKIEHFSGIRTHSPQLGLRCSRLCGCSQGCLHGGKPAAREDGYADMPGIPGAVTDTTGVVSDALDVRTIDCWRNRCEGSCSCPVGEGDPGSTTRRPPAEEEERLGEAPLEPLPAGELQLARLADGDVDRW